MSAMLNEPPMRHFKNPRVFVRPAARGISEQDSAISPMCTTEPMATIDNDYHPDRVENDKRDDSESSGSSMTSANESNSTEPSDIEDEQSTFADVVRQSEPPGLRSRRKQVEPSLTIDLLTSRPEPSQGTCRTPDTGFYNISVQVIEDNLRYAYDLLERKISLSFNRGYPKKFWNNENLSFTPRSSYREYPIAPGTSIWKFASFRRAGKWRVIFSRYGSFVGCTEKNNDDPEDQTVHRVKLGSPYQRLQGFRVGRRPSDALMVRPHGFPDRDCRAGSEREDSLMERRATAPAVQVRRGTVTYGIWNGHFSVGGGSFQAL